MLKCKLNAYPFVYVLGICDYFHFRVDEVLLKPIIIGEEEEVENYLYSVKN